MENQFKQTSGICLIIGSFLLIVTMVLHPSGGHIAHILKISNVIVVSHSLAIFSLPFVGFGFYGLSMALLTKNRLSILALMMIGQGLVAAMIAGTINGLTLPLFLSKYADSYETHLPILQPIIHYGFSINRPMDYILIGASILSIGIWSMLMILSTKFPRWLGYYGLVLILMGIVGLLVRFNFIDLWGFRTFIFGMVSWVILAGIWMISIK
jgi:hypothetical protein